MSGNDGMRGYLIQTIISLLESLNDTKKWLSITIEPLNESQKVDVVWYYPNNEKKIAQIKSSINDFKFASIEKWATEIKESNATEYQVIIVGTCEEKIRKQPESKINGVNIIIKPLDFEMLINSASQKFNEYLTEKEYDIRPKIAKLIIEGLITKFEKFSTYGKQISRDDFDKIIIDWYLEIVKQETTNPRVKYIEVSKNTTKKEIDKVEKILQLINFTNLPSKKFKCINENKHTINEDLKEHYFDFICQNQSKLIDNSKDISLISIIKTENYDTSNKFKRELNSYLIDLSQSTECAIESGILKVKEKENLNISNILIWLNDSDLKEFIHQLPLIYNKLDYKHLFDNSVFFIIDESRLNFIKNAINTAKYFKPDQSIKFLYPLTEHNSQLNKITSRDFHFPFQYYNSTILPLIIESKKESAVFVFCYDNYRKSELKRIIWLTFKITTGFANEYKIFFPDFDEINDKDDAYDIINSFQDDIFSSRVKVHKYSNFPDVVLEEKNNSILSKTFHEGYEHNTDKPISLGAELIDTLIYGDKLQSVLNSSTLSISDLKLFLSQRGIFLKSSEKKDILPFMATLLFSPREIDVLKKLMIDKEKKYKDVPISPVEWKSELNLKNALNFTKPDFTEIENNFNFVEPLSVEFISENEFIIDFKTKKENRLEGLYEGTSFPSGKVTCKLDNNFLDIDYSYQDAEPAKACRAIIKEIQLAYKTNDLIENEAKAIMFSDFDNSNSARVDFLMSFEKYPNTTFFKRCSTINIKLCPDSNKNLPEDLEKMRGKVKKLDIDGNNLNDLDYVYKSEYKDCILLERVRIKYELEPITHKKQYCVVEYGFSNALSSNQKDGKFQTSSYIVMSEEMKKASNFQSIERKLKQEIKKLVTEKYNQFKNLLIKQENKENLLNELID